MKTKVFSLRARKLQFGHHRSKALNATQRTFSPNLQVFRFHDEKGKLIKIRLPVRELRTWKTSLQKIKSLSTKTHSSSTLTK